VQLVSEDRVVLETTKARVGSTNWSAPRNIKSFRRN
jgi:hypothetical protein